MAPPSGRHLVAFLLNHGTLCAAPCLIFSHRDPMCRPSSSALFWQIPFLRVPVIFPSNTTVQRDAFQELGSASSALQLILCQTYKEDRVLFDTCPVLHEPLLLWPVAELICLWWRRVWIFFLFYFFFHIRTETSAQKNLPLSWQYEKFI